MASPNISADPLYHLSAMSGNACGESGVVSDANGCQNDRDQHRENEENARRKKSRQENVEERRDDRKKGRKTDVSLPEKS